MQGLRLFYKNIRGSRLEVTDKDVQFLFLEPREKVVIRYYFTKTTLDVNSTKILNEVRQTEKLEVKFREPTGNVLSRIADFKSIEEREDAVLYFDVNFNVSDIFILDALYISKTKDRLKVKIRTIEDAIDTFENEHTVSDGPDEFVKLVDVTIRPENVSYTYVYRRDGRLKKYPSTVRYETLADILKERILYPDRVDSNLEKESLIGGLNTENYFIDYLDKTIYKIESDRKLFITSEQLGHIIKTYGSKLDILNLLTTTDLSTSQHPLIKEGETLVVSCDGICSLPPVVINAIQDERGVIL